MGLETNNLTVKDKELILEQCIHQNATTPRQIEGFTLAYSRAKSFAEKADWDRVTSEKIYDLLMEFGSLVEDGDNFFGSRSVDASFRSGNHGVLPDNISKAIEGWVEAYVENRVAPEKIYHEFETIHPFNDGNGRVGDLFWKMAVKRNTGVWPEELPPDVFGRDRGLVGGYESSFGEVEN